MRPGGACEPAAGLHEEEDDGLAAGEGVGVVARHGVDGAGAFRMVPPVRAGAGEDAADLAYGAFQRVAKPVGRAPARAPGDRGGSESGEALDLDDEVLAARRRAALTDVG